jgi:hypothetical protein
MPRLAIGVILATILAPLPQLTPLKLPVLDGPGQRVRLPYCRLILQTVLIRKTRIGQ